MTVILGVSAFYHDSAAALLIDGKLISAAQEERFTRKKHDEGFPINSIEFVLKQAGIGLRDVDYVSFYDKPLLKFERLLETFIAHAPRGFALFRKAMPVWLREKLFQKDLIHKHLKSLEASFSVDKILFSEHHFSHAASAYYPSPYNEAVVLTIDGVGEWATTTVAIGKEHNLNIVKELHFPHSLGLLYSAFTYYTGFKVNSGEYKLMGLAPYGKPVYKSLILENLIDLKDDGSFRLNQFYFNYAAGLTMTNSHFEKLFGHLTRKPDTEDLSQFHMDIASSIQAVTEEVVLRLTRSLALEYGIKNLCLAGGVALNCVANGKILEDKSFENVWIQPAAGDAGGAIGTAYAVWHQELKRERFCTPQRDSMSGAYLGPQYRQSDIEARLRKLGAVFKVYDTEKVILLTAEAAANGKVIGWHQGRMEFGPRSLGARSILADPRTNTAQKTVNLKIKYRESFRPFAPSVLREDVADWFNLDTDSPYMLFVSNVHISKQYKQSEDEEKLFGIEKLNVKRSEIPAVTHVDYSARIQTVHKETNPKFHRLLEVFKSITNCPVLLNTSFNVRGEPIVESPEDAFKCFMGTEMDLLICGDAILLKEDQCSSNIENYKNKYELD